MRAIGMTEYGEPEVLHELEVDPEPLEPDEVRVRVAAATVNPTDVSLRHGLRPRPEGGVDVPGMEIAGAVTEVGADVRGLAVGDEVFGIVVQAGTHGAYREEIVLPADSVARVPAGHDLFHAATIPMNGLTTVQAIDVVGLAPGQVLAVTGAAGAVGGYAIQLGKADGLTVVADASEADEALVRGLGADVVVPRGAGFAGAVRELYPDGVDGLIDGALMGAEALPAVKDGGRMATVRGFSDGERDIEVIPVGVRKYWREQGKLDRLRALVEAGQLTLRVAEIMPASEAVEAHRRVEAGGLRGRIVLDLTK